MKIYTDGARQNTAQINRIDKGFKELGHELTQNVFEADLIYSNNQNGFWGQIIKEKWNSNLKSGARIIFNVLDIPEWNFPNYNLQELYNQLIEADKITCISQYVQSKLLNYFRLESTVIYNPIKEINNEQRKAGIKKYPQYKALMLGRLCDPSKRAKLAIESLLLAGIKEGEVAVIGSEPIGWGRYLGVVRDDVLNDLYNSVDFVMMTSLGEGMGLPALEAIMAGAMPIICHDLTTFNEFFPKWLGNYPSPYAIAFFIKNNKQKVEEHLRKQIVEKFHFKKIARNILNVYDNLIRKEKTANCKKCGGSGWIWSNETSNRYLCDECVD